MTLNDIYAAQIEAHYFFYIWSGAFFTILILVVWYGLKQIAEVISQQKIVYFPPQLGYWPPMSNEVKRSGVTQ